MPVQQSLVIHVDSDTPSIPSIEISFDYTIITGTQTVIRIPL